MDKETILKLYKEENEDQDEMERSALFTANNIALLVGGIMCVIIMWLNLFLGKQPNFSVLSVFFSMMSASHFVKYRKTKKTVELVLFLLNTFTAIVFFILFIRYFFR